MRCPDCGCEFSARGKPPEEVPCPQCGSLDDDRADDFSDTVAPGDDDDGEGFEGRGFDDMGEGDDFDAGDFVLECTTCGSEFIAGENITEDGEHVRCPECGALDVE